MLLLLYRISYPPETPENPKKPFIFFGIFYKKCINCPKNVKNSTMEIHNSAYLSRDFLKRKTSFRLTIEEKRLLSSEEIIYFRFITF